MFMGFDGILTAFGWQAIHIPLVYLTIAAFCWQLSGGGLVWGAVSNAFRQRDLEVRDAISIPTATTTVSY